MKSFRPTADPSEIAHKVHRSNHLLNESDQHKLSDVELLSMLFSVTLQKLDTNALAGAVLQPFGSIGQLMHASSDDLLALSVHDERLVQIVKILRFCLRRIISERTAEQIRINSPRALIEYVKVYKNVALSGCRRVIFLDRDARLIRDQSMAMWQSKSGACRCIAEGALQADAFGLIVIEFLYAKKLHPTRNSISMYQNISKSMINIDIALHDYLIVGINQFYSFKQEKIIDF